MLAFNNKRGAITVFQCIVFTGLLVLTGMLVDVSRIMVAERKIQSAVNTSVRSVLAEYDGDIIGDYGVFALDTQSNEAALENTFKKYLKMNLKENNKNFNFIDYEIDFNDSKTSIHGFQNLIDNDVFRKQIMEYIKYKAPLTITQGVIEKFSSSGLQRKLKFSQSEAKARSKRESLRKQVESINGLLDDCKIDVKSAELQEIKELSEKLTELSLQNQIVVRYFKDYEEEKKKSDEIAEKTDEGEINDNESGIIKSKSEFESILEESKRLKDNIANNIAQLDVFAAKVEPLQNEMIALETDLENALNKIARLESSKKDIKPETQLKEIDNQIEILSRQSDNMKSEIDSLEQKTNAIKSEVKFDEMSKITLKDEVGNEEETDIKAKDDTENYLNGLKEKTEKYLKDIDPSWLINEKDIKDILNIDSEQYKEMGIKSKNNSSKEIEAEEKNKNVMDYMQNLFDLLADTAKGGVEKIYTVEYIMDKYTYFTSKTERAHYFEKGEVEYILWGSNSQIENIAKTMGSVWFLRFAIDSIDSFATSPDPEPVSRLIGALIKGFALSCYDTVELYKGKEISICPSLKNKIKLNYPDHLRIFLLLKSSNTPGYNSELLNMRQLMQVNIQQVNNKFELKNQNTALNGKTEVKINLWFLPILQLDKLGFKNFEGGKYVICKEIYMSY